MPAEGSYERPPGSVAPTPLQRLLHVLLPAPCLACREPVWEAREALGLCAGCRDRLVEWPRQGCATCGKPLSGAALPAGYRCGGCRRRTPPYSRFFAAWSYQPPLDAVLTGLKFRRLDYLGAELARRLEAALGDALGDGPELVVPVPLHWSRLLGRGFNQAAAIARPLAAALAVPTASVLRRRRRTPPQSRLDRAARRRNLRGAFVARRPRPCRGRRVLLVDDVYTTGATLEAAARCLRQAGAREVWALAAARTPTPAEALLLPGA